MTCNGVQGSGVRLLGVRGVPLGGSRQVAGSSGCAGGPTLAAVGFPAPCGRVAGVAPGVLRALMAWRGICAVLRVAWLDILREVPPGVGDMTRGSACTSYGGLPTPLAKSCEPSTIQTPLANQQLHSSPTHQQWPRQQVRVTQAACGQHLANVYRSSLRVAPAACSSDTAARQRLRCSSLCAAKPAAAKPKTVKSPGASRRALGLTSFNSKHACFSASCCVSCRNPASCCQRSLAWAGAWCQTFERHTKREQLTPGSSKSDAAAALPAVACSQEGGRAQGQGRREEGEGRPQAQGSR